MCGSLHVNTGLGLCIREIFTEHHSRGYWRLGVTNTEGNTLLEPKGTRVLGSTGWIWTQTDWMSLLRDPGPLFLQGTRCS